MRNLSLWGTTRKKASTFAKIKQHGFKIVTCSILCLMAEASFAKTELPIPRFVSLRASEANIRTGPSVRYPVKWVFIKKGEPVEIVAEFEQWRKIRDFQGDAGWVHETMLSGKRHVIITAKKAVFLYKKPDTHSNKVAKIEPNVRADLLSCDIAWCRIEAGDYKGWIEKQSLWGVYANEKVE